MPKLKRLSVKEKKFVSKVVKTGNGTQSALEVYDTKDRKVAQVIASQNMSKPHIIEEIDKVLKKNNITLEGTTNRLQEIADDWMPDKISSDTVLKANIELLKLMKAYPDKIQRHESKSIRIQLNDKNYKDLIDLHKAKSQE